MVGKQLIPEISLLSILTVSFSTFSFNGQPLYLAVDWRLNVAIACPVINPDRCCSG
jgi:hypothetical protein